MSGRPFEVLSGAEGDTGYDLVGNFGSEEAATKRAEKYLLSGVRYGFAYKSLCIVQGPGVRKRLRLQAKPGIEFGKPQYDPDNWTMVDAGPGVLMTEVKAP